MSEKVKKGKNVFLDKQEMEKKKNGKGATRGDLRTPGNTKFFL